MYWVEILRGDFWFPDVRWKEPLLKGSTSPHLLVSYTEVQTFNKSPSRNMIIGGTRKQNKIRNYRWIWRCRNVPRFGDCMRVFSVVVRVMVHAGPPKVFTGTRARHGQRHHLLSNFPLNKSINTSTTLHEGQKTNLPSKPIVLHFIYSSS